MTAERIEPLADVFGGMLFAAMGMMIDPRFFLRELRTIVGMVVQVCLWKVVVISSVVKAFGHSTSDGILCALLLADISELSLVFMAKAHGSGELVQRRTYLLFLCTTMATLLITPIVHKLVPKRSWERPPPADGAGVPGASPRPAIEMRNKSRDSDLDLENAASGATPPLPLHQRHPIPPATE